MNKKNNSSSSVICLHRNTLFNCLSVLAAPFPLLWKCGNADGDATLWKHIQSYLNWFSVGFVNEAHV